MCRQVHAYTRRASAEAEAGPNDSDAEEQAEDAALTAGALTPLPRLLARTGGPNSGGATRLTLLV